MILERLEYPEEVEGVVELMELWPTELKEVRLNAVELEGVEVDDAAEPDDPERLDNCV